ncbi:transferrin [Diachasma alloeum]|uniref:transferrin n=1 Tax=Diachasma alloeum TaxID=454923 RepID=UPI0007383264|nr:transferrin [Diachasma alloeum]
MKCLLSVILLSLGTTWAAKIYRLCAPDDISDSECSLLAKGDSPVLCERVTDRTECAIKIAKGRAHFGVFNAEELLLAYHFYPDEIKPIAQLRHRERRNREYDFQSVVVVPESFNSNEGLAGLKNGGLCHPGFSKSQNWNDYILKFFERKAWSHQCNGDVSVAENEAINLKNFFGRACRPGKWVEDPAEDKRLKQKYPQLCELCDNNHDCAYYNNDHHGHMGALECLVSGRGKAAYVAYDYAYQYFGVNLTGPEPRVTKPGFQFLCPNGSLKPLTVSEPCAWIGQPWSAVAVKKDRSSELVSSLKTWLASPFVPDSWKDTLNKILKKEGEISNYTEDQTLSTYLATGREINLPEKPCGNTIRWCTISPQETGKCRWVAKEALLLGIEPKFTCVETNSTFDCLRTISKNLADIITIDSNYGYLARTIFNLTTLLYVEPMKTMNSAIIAVVKNSQSPKFGSFKSLKGKTACFPEYGGIAWLSLINVARNQKIIPDTCDYPQALAGLFSGACTPGINDTDHSDVTTKVEVVQQLCSSCPLQADNSTCSASPDNTFYGDEGVLDCLDGPGDIGFVEIKNVGGELRAGKIRPDDYRVLCKNGSLAVNTGFNIDSNCALSVTIDSEVLGRSSNRAVENMDTTIALLNLEAWLGYTSRARRTIRIYDSFTGYRDLLFKETTVALRPKDSDVESVVAYKELFENFESCRNSGVGIISNTLTTVGGVIIAIIMLTQ